MLDNKFIYLNKLCCFSNYNTFNLNSGVSDYLLLRTLLAYCMYIEGEYDPKIDFRLFTSSWQLKFEKYYILVLLNNPQMVP